MKHELGPLLTGVDLRSVPLLNFLCRSSTCSFLAFILRLRLSHEPGVSCMVMINSVAPGLSWSPPSTRPGSSCTRTSFETVAVTNIQFSNVSSPSEEKKHLLFLCYLDMLSTSGSSWCPSRGTLLVLSVICRFISFRLFSFHEISLWPYGAQPLICWLLCKLKALQVTGASHWYPRRWLKVTGTATI